MCGTVYYLPDANLDRQWFDRCAARCPADDDGTIAVDYRTAAGTHANISRDDAEQLPR
jgi:hypothetical protein